MKRLLSADENQSPSQKRLSLSLRRPEVQLRKPPQRFGPPTSEEDVRSAAKGVIPLITKCSNAWALGNLCSWMETRNSNSDEKVPEDLLSCRKLRLSASGYVALCMRHEKRTVSDTRLPQSAEWHTGYGQSMGSYSCHLCHCRTSLLPQRWTGTQRS